MARPHFVLALAALAAPCAAPAQQTPREAKVRADKARVEKEGYWIYNDLPRAVAEAAASGKPLAVVLRCVPCEECVKLDDDLVDADPVVRPLLDRYVRARVVSANGLDLSLFQFDTDQSFAVFLLNADGTIYGRFGTRSHRTNWVGDVSLEGLAEALRGGLELHAGYPANKAALAGKRGPAPEVPAPEKYPSLGKYGPRVDFANSAVASCIHCHQVGDAAKEFRRAAGKPLPPELLAPYPHPRSLGLILDPKKRAAVTRVEPNSPADRAGFRAGDALTALNGQPLLSIADVQWVLHRTPAGGGAVKAELLRDGKPVSLTWELGAGWRDADDGAWRVGTWTMRRMGTGGMSLEPMPADARPAGGMALRVKHVGRYGPHAAAWNAGVRPGDVLVAFDGRSDFAREADVLAHALTARRPGDRVAVRLLRDGKPVDVTIPMQP